MSKQDEHYLQAVVECAMAYGCNEVYIYSMSEVEDSYIWQ